MSDDYEEWEAPDPADEAQSAQPEVQLFYPNVYTFVDDWLLPRYRRNPGSTKWDPRWFENLEALDRLEALWRSFEYMRLQGMTGMLVFWRDYLDPMMRELTGDDGVFWYVGAYNENKEPPLLHSEPAPAEVLQ